MKTVDSGTKQKRLQMMKKVSLKVIDLLNASYPKKGKLHLNIKKDGDGWGHVHPSIQKK